MEITLLQRKLSLRLHIKMMKSKVDQSNIYLFPQNILKIYILNIKKDIPIKSTSGSRRQITPFLKG